MVGVKEEGAAAVQSPRSQAEIERLVAQLEAEMKAAARALEFERAAALRDEIDSDPAARA